MGAEEFVTLIHNLFKYKKRGVLVRKVSTAHNARKGMVVGVDDRSTGYITVSIFKKKYYVHRLVWMHHHGYIDGTVIIDHIDRDKHNNKIDNLRIVDKAENGWNRKVKGYTYCKKSCKFFAQLKVRGKQINIGYFDTKKEAKKAYKVAKKIHHKIKERRNET